MVLFGLTVEVEVNVTGSLTSGVVGSYLKETVTFGGAACATRATRRAPASSIKPSATYDAPALRAAPKGYPGFSMDTSSSRLQA